MLNRDQNIIKFLINASAYVVKAKQLLREKLKGNRKRRKMCVRKVDFVAVSPRNWILD